MENAGSTVSIGPGIGRQSPIALFFLKFGIMGLVQASVLRFVSGRADWSRAWIYVGFIMGFMVVGGMVLARLSPDLLAERSKVRQGTKTWDKWLVPFVALDGPLGTWCVAALDVRAHWPPMVPVWWSVAAFAVCGMGLLFTFWAMLTNRFFAATVRIQEERGHVVIDGGPYRYVRHPGYTGALALSLATPVALGSWLALIPAAVLALVLAVRTALEDRTLRAELKGYEEYASRVRSRLVPGLW